MRAVKNVVSTGRTVVCTIHQPSIEIFESFDGVIISYFILPHLDLSYLVPAAMFIKCLRTC
ncbi:hypothetical protein EJ110_NYTH15620 [Nymphaea thermarum]|nr:hypothetical protein EJ110_NYTH15620 [Nymphaea thermarum]